MNTKEIIQCLKSCKLDLDNYYEYHMKSNVITRSLKVKRAEGLDAAIKELGGKPAPPEVQEELHF